MAKASRSWMAAWPPRPRRLIAAVLCVGLSVGMAPWVNAQPLPHESTASPIPPEDTALDQEASIQDYVPGEVIVTYDHDLTRLERKDVRLSVAEQPEVERLSRNVDVISVDPDQSISTVIDTLEDQDGVLHAEPNYIIRSTATSDDSWYVSGDMWGMYGPLTDPSSSYGINAAPVWADITTGSPQVFVAVLDSGIDISHPDLAANIWTNQAEASGLPGVDDDGNGYVDDLNGWDFVSDDASVFDAGEYRHGTHVAGTIGAVGGNGMGVSGVAWDVTMISAKIIGAGGEGTVADAIKAVDYVTMLRTKLGMDIVATNNSWTLGDRYSTALEDAIRRGGDAGILFVASAGNDGDDNDATTQWPANMDCATTSRPWDCVISVTAIDQSGQLAGFANRGAANVDIAAPGVGIVSTLPGGSYGPLSGTSMATPHVTGAIALCASANRGHPIRDIRQDLFDTGRPIASGGSLLVTGKTVDASALVSSCQGAAQSFSGTPLRFTASAYYTNRVRLDWEDQTSGEYEQEIQVAVGSRGCSGTFTHLAYIGPGLTTYTARNLAEAEFHCFRIRSLRDGQASAWIVSNLTITWTSNSPFISGRVTLNDGLTNVARASVRWRAKGANSASDLVVYSDASGFYYLQVPSGTEGTLWVQTPYETRSASNAARVIFPEPILPVGMRVGGNLTVTTDTTVNLRMPPAHTVTFRLIDEITGLPIPGARVSGQQRNVPCMADTSAGYEAFPGAGRPSGADPALLGCWFDPFGHYSDSRPRTDVNGEIVLALVADQMFARTYDLAFAHPGTTSRLVQYSLRSSDDTVVSVSMADSTTISGRVVMHDQSTPVSQAQVRWRARSFTSESDVTTYSTGDGSYTINVPTGVEGTLWVQVPNQAPTAIGSGSITYPSPMLPLGMKVGGNLTVVDDSVVDLRMPPQKTVTFLFEDAFSGAAIPYAKVSGEQRNIPCMADTMAGYSPFPGARQPSGFDPALLGCWFDPFGHYANYTARADANGQITLAFIDQSLFRRDYAMTATHPTDDVRVVRHVFSATDDTSVTLKVEGYRTLTGRVLLSDGITTVHNASVRWRARGSTSLNDLTTLSAADGSYSLQVPSKVEGTLWVDVPSKAPSARGQNPGPIHPTPRLPLGMRVGGNLTVSTDTVVDLSMPPMKMVTLRVVDAYTENPVEGAVISGDRRNIPCMADTSFGYTAFPGAGRPSGFDPALLGCWFDPMGHYADAPPLTDANGEVTLALIDDALFARSYTITSTHPLDNARVGAVTIHATDDTTIPVVIPGTPGIPKQPQATPGTTEVVLTWEEPWDGSAFIDFYRVWIALDPDGPYERVTSGTCSGDLSPLTRSCVVADLEPGETYYFAIIAHNVVGAGDPAQITATTIVDPGPTPSPESTPGPTSSPESTPGPTPSPESTPGPTPSPESTPSIPQGAAPGAGVPPVPMPPNPTGSTQPGPEPSTDAPVTEVPMELPMPSAAPQPVPDDVASGETSVSWSVDRQSGMIRFGERRITMRSSEVVLRLGPQAPDGSRLPVSDEQGMELPTFGFLDLSGAGLCQDCEVAAYWITGETSRSGTRGDQEFGRAIPLGALAVSAQGVVAGRIRVDSHVPTGRGVVQIIVHTRTGAPTSLNIAARIVASQAAPPVRNVTVAPADRSLAVSWTPPSPMGDRGQVSYVARTFPGTGSCTAVMGESGCTINGLHAGIDYRVEVESIPASGTKSLSYPSQEVSVAGKSTVISLEWKKRKGRWITFFGSAPGLEGATVVAVFRASGAKRSGERYNVRVQGDSTFSWRMRVDSSVRVTVIGFSIRSNTVTITSRV